MTVPLGKTRGAVAGVLSERTGLSSDAVAELLSNGLSDLGRMLSQADSANVLWIIQD